MSRRTLSFAAWTMTTTMVLAAGAGSGGGGCASSQEPATSNLTIDDLVVAGDKMKQSLNASEFLAGRTPQSKPVVIVTNKVENLTDNIISQSEQWSTVLRVQNAQPVQEFARQRNVRFVVPPERREYAEQTGGGVEVEQAGALQPTHVLTAQFTSSARTGEDKSGRVTSKQNYYYLEFKLADIQNREIVWSDAFEFKRVARGELND